MSNLNYERESDEIQQIALVVSKAFLIIVGLLFIIVPSLDPTLTVANLRAWQAFGVVCLIVAVFWICTEKRALTPREELESFLVEAAKRYAHVGSTARLVEEYRARGADDLSLSRLRGAPRLLRERAEDKISLGLIISGTGSLLALNSILLATWKGPGQSYLLSYAFLGVGLGAAHIAQGLRLKWYARRFSVSKTQPQAPSHSQPQHPSIVLDHERDEAA